MPNEFNSPEGDLENYFITESWLVDQWIGDELWAWGLNDYGYLGINNLINRSTPVTTLAGGNNWKQVSCGNRHSAVIKTDGSLWLWGRNDFGQLGDNTAAAQRLTPITTFSGGNNWKQVSCGSNNTTAIKTDGTLWTWGYNGVGQLGDNTVINRSTPVTTLTGGNDWKQVSSSTSTNSHIAAIKTDGTLWIWGLNGQGQLGNNTSGSNIFTPVTTFSGGNNWKQVSCGYLVTSAIKTDGTLWTWGYNAYGQLGDNTTTNKITPVTTFSGGNNWKQVSVGTDHVTSSIKTDGTLWAWGRNVNFFLGIGSNTNNRLTPVTTFVGGNNWKQVSRASAIKTDGTLWIWGTGGSVLGTNNSSDLFTPVTTFAGGNNWKQVDRGGNHVLAVKTGVDI